MENNQNDWKSSLLNFIKLNINDVLQLKKLEADLRQFKKGIEGTATNPTDYALGKKEIINNFETLTELAKEQEEFEVNDNKLIINLDDKQVEIKVTTSARVDANAILNNLVLDGIITAEQLTEYKEANTKETKSFSISEVK